MSKFNVVAASNEDTVVAEYTPEQRRATDYQSEAELEKDLIKRLQTQGYDYVAFKSETEFVANLRGQLELLNEYIFTDTEWERFFATVLANKNEGIVEKTKKIQEERRFAFRLDNGTIKNIKIIDGKKIHNNRLQVMNQYAECGGIHDKEMLKAEYGIRVVSATQPISDDEGGEFYEMFLEWNDEKYSKRLSKRVREGLDTSVANGTFCGGYLIYGYKIRKEPIAGKNDRYIKYVEIDPETAPIVRYAFEEYDKGVEKKDIAAALNAQGHRLNGKPFTGKSFDKWVVNDKYTGVFKFGERVCDNMYPPIIDKALFDRVQQRLNKNKYFAGGTATARVPYLLTGKAECLHCGTDMVSDGGTSKTGIQHHYYACKSKKKNKCDKRREGKDELELYATETVHDFLGKPENAELAVTDTLNYYDKRTGEVSLKSVESKIAKARKDVDEMATAFVEAKSGLLRATIEKKMTEYERLLEDLEKERAQLEFERGFRVTKEDLLAFVSELLKGDPNDKEHQRKIIDNLVYKIFVGDNDIIPFFTFKTGKEIAELRLASVKKALEGIFGVQTQLPPVRHKC